MTETRSILPSFPSQIARLSPRTVFFDWFWKPTSQKCPVASEAAIIASTSCTVAAGGFSTSTS